MLTPPGAHSAHGVHSIAARSFYTALFRYSQITCPARAHQHQPSRRRYGSAGAATTGSSGKGPRGKIQSQTGKSKTELHKDFRAWTSFQKRLKDFKSKEALLGGGGAKQGAGKEREPSVVRRLVGVEDGERRKQRKRSLSEGVGDGEPHRKLSNAKLRQLVTEGGQPQYKLSLSEFPELLSGAIECSPGVGPPPFTSSQSGRLSSEGSQLPGKLSSLEYRRLCRQLLSAEAENDGSKRKLLLSEYSNWLSEGAENGESRREHSFPEFISWISERAENGRFSSTRSWTAKPKEKSDMPLVRRVNNVHPSKSFVESVRSLMRSVTQPVAVVTTTTRRIPFDAEKPQISEVIGDLRGMTISSFTTVSLEPEPIISLNIRTPSSTLDALRSTRQFSVHFPSQSANGRDLAQVFVKGNSKWGMVESPFKEGLWTLDAPTDQHRKTGVFLPIPNDGTILSLRCEVFSDKLRHGGDANGFINVADHVIVLARILDVRVPGCDEDAEGRGSVLCYEHGGYAATTALESKLEDANKEETHEESEIGGEGRQ